MKAVGLELVETENREPVRGKQAAEIWSALFPALAGDEFYAVDFFSHIDRVQEFCKARKIEFRESWRALLGSAATQSRTTLPAFRTLRGRNLWNSRGTRLRKHPDAALEGDLSKRGVDAYQPAYERYFFCAICEPEDGWVTLLSATLWASEVIRRVRPAVLPFDIYIARPQ